jgi:deoxyribonuclease V
MQNPEQAIRLQKTLCQRLVLTWDDHSVNTIGGIDASYTSNSIYAAIAVFLYPEITWLYSVTGEAPQAFPYIPGLLAYRVGPAIQAAWEKLPLKPGLLMFHGHGIARPRGIGLASQMGLWLETPSIGVAKRRLYGCQSEIGPNVGQWSELLDEIGPQRLIGAVLRTRVHTQPVYVSAGHLIDLQHSITFVSACCRGNRLPEPIRVAHRVAYA